MENTNNENLDSQNEEQLDEQDELDSTEANEEDDVDTLREKLSATAEKNKQLFERAKKAEGFVKDADGQWVKKPKEEPKQTKQDESKPEVPDIDKLLDEKLEKRELDSLDLGDDLKAEVRNYAKLNNVSIKKALESDYIKYKQDKVEREQTNESASLKGTRKPTSRKDYKNMAESPEDLKKQIDQLDLTTSEGMAEHEKIMAAMKEALG